MGLAAQAACATKFGPIFRVKLKDALERPTAGEQRDLEPGMLTTEVILLAVKLFGGRLVPPPCRRKVCTGQGLMCRPIWYMCRSHSTWDSRCRVLGHTGVPFGLRVREPQERVLRALHWLEPHFGNDLPARPCLLPTEVVRRLFFQNKVCFRFVLLYLIWNGRLFLLHRKKHSG